MIYKAKVTDSYIVAQLAIKLWEHHDISSLHKEFIDIINNKNNAVYLYVIDNKPIGFAQCSLRFDYVEGTSSTPVGYLEGIYIDEEYRRNGYAKALVQACEQFSKENGAKEFASDCELNNLESLQLHLKLGFIEVNRIRCFNKKIN